MEATLRLPRRTFLHLAASAAALPAVSRFAGAQAYPARIRAGRLRALAVTTLARSESLSDLPTISDFVPGYEASSWHGIGVPKNTPAEIIDKLNREIIAALADPRMKTRLA